MAFVLVHRLWSSMRFRKTGARVFVRKCCGLLAARVCLGCRGRIHSGFVNHGHRRRASRFFGTGL